MGRAMDRLTDPSVERQIDKKISRQMERYTTDGCKIHS